MFDSLVRNAIDFMKVSLGQLESSPKYSVINFCSAVEIFFKARLMAEHWSLVVAKPENATLSKFKEGKEKSVTLDHAITRLENIAGEKFSKHVKDTFCIMREHRNKLAHFFHEEYVNTTNPKTISQIVSEQCRAWLYLHNLLTIQWKKHFSKFDKEISELDELIHKNRKFLEVKFKSIGPELKFLMAEHFNIVTCTSCGFHAFCQTEDPAPIKDCTCKVCGYHDRYLNIPCTACSKEQVYEGDGDIECADCKKKITVDDIIEKFTPKEFQKSHSEPSDDLLAYCHYCEYVNPSVAKLSGYWVCLACLELHDAPDYCDWCNEYITGDWDEYFGCPHCEGRKGWKDDD